MRVTVQLVSAKVEEMLWGDRYDGEIEDVLDMQSRVAETVAKEIAVHVSSREAKQLAKRRSVNPEAHVEYLKGRHTAAGGSPQAIELGLRYYQRALELDPTYAPAWAGLAYCHNVRAGRGMAKLAYSGRGNQASHAHHGKRVGDRTQQNQRQEGERPLESLDTHGIENAEKYDVEWQGERERHVALHDHHSEQRHQHAHQPGAQCTSDSKQHARAWFGEIAAQSRR